MEEAGNDMTSRKTYEGGCHCGRVRFEVDAPEKLEVTECNCSICSKAGFLHLFVSRDDFRLLRGEDELTTYTFNTKTAQHLFCGHCGIKSFYVPRSHPDGYSVNARCLDAVSAMDVAVTYFDGRSWEQNVSKLSPLSD
jgi:hypothetical protein